jgi:hypothetical protein
MSLSGDPGYLSEARTFNPCFYFMVREFQVESSENVSRETLFFLCQKERFYVISLQQTVLNILHMLGAIEKRFKSFFMEHSDKGLLNRF